MNKSQRASETQSIRSIKQSLTHMKQEMKPTPTVRPVRSDPKALPQSKSFWIPRKVRITEQSLNGTVDITALQVGSFLGLTGSESSSFKVLGIKAWNVTNQATSSNSIIVKPSAGIFTNINSGVSGEDYGSATHLPGVMINIPDLISATLSTASTSTSLMTITFPFGVVNPQFCVVDLDLIVQT
jgi:hypothetical protein